MLDEAVGDHAYLLRQQFLPFERPTDETLQRYARDHGHSD